jgi:hypothetical protein
MVAGEYLREHHADLFADPKLNRHFHHGLFHGFENDAAMLRIGSMNMLLHGIENPDIQRRDSLAQDHSGEDESTRSFWQILPSPVRSIMRTLRKTCSRSSRPRRPSSSSSLSSSVS